MIWMDGKLQDKSTVFDLNNRIRLGHGVFDTMLVIKDKVIAHIHIPNLPLHIIKITHSAKVFGIDISGSLLNEDAAMNAAGSLLQDKPSGQYILNIFISAGQGGQGLQELETATPQIIMRALDAPKIFKETRAIIAQSVRKNEGSPLSQIKSLNYGDHILALQEAKTKDANEAIIMNNAGHICCATTSNIFLQKGEKLLTPPVSDGCINGVMRQKMLQEFDILEKSITPKDLKNCDGIYLSNSVRGIYPLISLGGKTLPTPSLPIAKNFHLN